MSTNIKQKYYVAITTRNTSKTFNEGQYKNQSNILNNISTTLHVQYVSTDYIHATEFAKK